MRSFIGTLALVVTAAIAAAGAAPAGADTATSIAIAAFEPQRIGSVIWDGGVSSLAQRRFLKGARLATVSPSGRALAFIRYAGDGFDLFHTGVYAGFEAKLAHVDGSRTTALAFAPDSRTIAFATPRGIELASIVPGRARRTLALPARWRGSSFQSLRFSLDGRLLAFSRTWGDGKENTLHNELAVIGIDGRGARSLAANPNPYAAQYRPSFSPDGRRIAFAAAAGSIAVVPTGGGPLVQLTSPRPAGTSRTDSDPLFSPDGETIVFTRAPGKGGSDVYLVGSDGSGLRRLTTTPLPEPGEARTGSSALAWAPDGTSVLSFRHDRFAVVAADGSGETVLARVGVQYEISSALWR
jgi:Tol biopolymer transport system component